MKLLALLAIIPAAFAIPSPMPAPEAYNPFFAPPTALTHSNNPISHGDLNSRRALSDIQHQVVIGQSRHEVRKRSSIRKVKRQSNGSCIPKPTGTGTTIVAPTTTATLRPGTTTQGQAATKPTTTTKKASTTSTSPKPAATNFTVDPDGNGPFKGQATCTLNSPSVQSQADKQTTTQMSDMVCLRNFSQDGYLTSRIVWSMAQELGTYRRTLEGIDGQLARIQWIKPK